MDIRTKDVKLENGTWKMQQLFLELNKREADVARSIGHDVLTVQRGGQGGVLKFVYIIIIKDEAKGQELKKAIREAFPK